MPSKKVTKKVSSKKGKLVAKPGRSAETHILHKHIPLTSPLGMTLVLALLVIVVAVAKAGYDAANVKPAAVNKIATNEMVERTETLTGKVSRELRDEKGQSRYMLTTADGKKYELIGVNEGRKIESIPKREMRRDGVDKENNGMMEQNKEVMSKEGKDNEKDEMKGKTPAPSAKPMEPAEITIQNRKVMEQYVGKTVTVLGKSSKMEAESDKGKNKPMTPKFLVKTITIAQ